MNLFKGWQQEWKARFDLTPKVLKDMDEMSANEMNYCLQYFFADVRKTDGSKYPPKTLKEIAAMLQHYCNVTFDRKWSIFTGEEFSLCRKVLDAEMRISAKEGNVKIPKRSDPISFSSEEELWRSGSLGCGSPAQLQNTLIYLLGLECGLRAATEHKAILFGSDSQLSLVTVESIKKLQYKETVSKTRHFGIKQARLEPKVVTMDPNIKEPNKCIVRLYKTFISHRPETHGSKGHSSFYLSPILNPTGDIWYKCCPLGIHQIEKVTKKLMLSIGITGNFTNTSLRRTAKTRMIAAGIPNEVTKRRIGHISEADRAHIHVESLQSKITSALRQEEAIVKVTQPQQGTSTGSSNVSDTIYILIEKGEKKVSITM